VRSVAADLAYLDPHLATSATRATADGRQLHDCCGRLLRATVSLLL